MERAIIIYLDVSDLVFERIKEFQSAVEDYIYDGFLADEDFDEVENEVLIESKHIQKLKLIKLLICYDADGIYNLNNVLGSLKAWEIIERLRRLDTMPIGQLAYSWEKEWQRTPNIIAIIKNKINKMKNLIIN